MSKRAVQNIHGTLSAQCKVENSIVESKEDAGQFACISNLGNDVSEKCVAAACNSKDLIFNDEVKDEKGISVLCINEIINAVLVDQDEELLKNLAVNLEKMNSSLNEVLDLYEKSDYEISRYVAKLFKRKLCYDLSSSLWYMFNGVLWVKDTRSQYVDYFQHSVIKSIDLCVEFSLMAQNDKYRNMAEKFFDIKNYFKRISDVEKFCGLATKGEDGIGHVGVNFDSDLRYIGALNGLIDLERLELLPGNPDVLVTKSLGVEYNPHAKEPEVFKKFLRDVFCYMSPMPEMPVLQDLPEGPRSALPELCFGDEEEKFQMWRVACDKIRMENEILMAKYNEDIVIIENSRSGEVEEVLSFLQRLFGYILTGRCNEHIFIIFFGQEGRNGKGVFVRLMMKVLGEYGGEVQPEILLRNNLRSSSGPSPEILDFVGKRFAVASETNQGEVFNTGVVKRLTGGDTLIGRAVFGKDMVRFSPSHTICLQTNYAPNASAEDSAFWARVIMLNFKRVFVDNPDPKNPLQLPKNINIEEELFEERESILKWIVDGVRLYREYGLSVPKSLEFSKREYRSSSDLIGDFISDYCLVGSNEKIEVSALIMSFNKWCQENGYKTMNKKTITDKLDRRGIEKKKHGNMFYFGVTLNNEGEDLYKRAMCKAGQLF